MIVILGYTDPTSISILLTSLIPIIGIVLVALAAFLGLAAIVVGTVIVVICIKAKRRAAKALHIDENANKEVEEDLIINPENKS